MPKLGAESFHWNSFFRHALTLSGGSDSMSRHDAKCEINYFKQLSEQRENDQY